MQHNAVRVSDCRDDIFTIPNILSFLRIALIPVIIRLYFLFENRPYAGYVLLLSGATDVIDGFIARRFNMVSAIGKALDPIADKMTQGAVLICLIFRFKLMVIPFIVLAVKELFMGISGLLIIKHTGSTYSAVWHGKAATCFLYAAIALHIFWPNVPLKISAASIAVASAMIMLSLFLYAVQNINTIKTAKSSV